MGCRERKELCFGGVKSFTVEQLHNGEIISISDSLRVTSAPVTSGGTSIQQLDSKQDDDNECCRMTRSPNHRARLDNDGSMTICNENTKLLENAKFSTKEVSVRFRLTVGHYD